MSAGVPDPAGDGGRAGGTGATGPLALTELARVRHELRTPINHILGYSEMLLEDPAVPTPLAADLRRVHTGGRRLQQLIGEYFSEATAGQPADWQRIQHELRTPVNQIIGYTELLQELAREQGCESAVADLQRIREAAGQWLALAERHLRGLNAVPATVPASSVSSVSSAVPGPGERGVRSAEPAEPADTPASSQVPGADAGGQILLVDDDEANRDMMARRLRRHGHAVTIAMGGEEALRLAASRAFDLVLLDMLMPGLSGTEVLVRLKQNPALRDMPVILLSALDQEAEIARCIELGAEDYLSKPVNPVFLWARLGASLERKRLRDRERAAFEALRQSERALAANLAEAAAYVRSLLPAPLTGEIAAHWCFQPGAQLGGDAFGYHWLDERHFAVFLLDVCGHGVGAALLSVSVLNTLRAQTLPGVDFRQPAGVLSALNRAFPMEQQNQLYFTIWYGVYDRRERTLVYSGAGHPPALLLPTAGAGEGRVELRQPAPAIGCLAEATYTQGAQVVPPGARLLVVSDGVYEIPRPDGRTGTWRDFAAAFVEPAFAAARPEQRLQGALAASGASGLEDDFSVVDLVFT